MGILDNAKQKFKEVSQDFAEEKITEVDWEVDRPESQSKPKGQDEDGLEDGFDEFDDEIVIEDEPEVVDQDIQLKKEKKKTDWSAKLNSLKPKNPPAKKEITPKKESKLIKPKKEKENPDEFFIVDENEDVFEDIRMDPEEAKKTRVKDVLESLEIPATYEVPANVLLKGDTDDLEFDIQVPRGYDMSQVMSFVSRVNVSIDWLQSRLKDRNRDIMALADVVDQLTITNRNLKVDISTYQGVSILSGDSHDDLQADNNMLRSENSKLKAEKSNLAKRLAEAQKMAASSKSVVSDIELVKENEELLKDKKFLEDEYLVLQNEKEALQEAYDALKSQMRYEEEEDSDDFISSHKATVTPNARRTADFSGEKRAAPVESDLPETVPTTPIVKTTPPAPKDQDEVGFFFDDDDDSDLYKFMSPEGK